MIIFTYIFLVEIVIIAVLQLLLALGAPLGELTMGGRFPGKLPGKMRAAAVVQMLILLIFGMIAASRAGIAFAQLYGAARFGIWVVFAFFIPGTILNISSKSRKEKYIMGPLNVLALICAFLTAIN